MWRIQTRDVSPCAIGAGQASGNLSDNPPLLVERDPLVIFVLLDGC